MATNISFSTYGFMNGILILSEENWRRFFKPFITDSVQSGLATIEGANMTVYVSAGECRCGAVMGILDEMIALDIANGDSTYNRIDSVIVQYTYGEPSTLAVAIIQGTPSANPVPPTLTKVYDTLWQMEIAQILVPSGATSSSEFTITDKRVIYESIESIIDDNTESEERVWSSQKTHEEIVSLSSEIYDSLNTKADAITRTASGSLVHITDAGAYPVDSLAVGIDPVQDLHGYDSPWPAGGGVNVMPTITPGTYSAGGITAVVGSDGTITVTGQKNVADSVRIIFPDYSENFTFPNNYYFHYRNSYASYDISFNCGGTNSAIGPVNRIFQRSEGTPSKAVNLWFAASVTEQLNFTLRPSIEATSSVTDWTPYSNICPISGWSNAVVNRTGKNIYPPTNAVENTSNGIIFTPQSDGGIWVHGTASAKADFTIYADNAFSIPANGTYTISCKNADPDCYFIVGGLRNAAGLNYKEIGTSGNQTFTKALTKGATGYNVLRVNSGTVIDKTVYPQFELSSAFTSYEAPQIQTLTISLGSTVYGAELNVLTGEMTVTHGIWTMSDTTTGKTWTYDSPSGHERFGCTYLNGVIKKPSASSELADIICTSYKTITANQTYTHSAGIGVGIDSNGVVWVYDPAYTDVQSFTTAMSGVQLVYPLATPVSVTLDANTMSLLLGENNLWSDTGDILNLTYPVESKSFIDKQIAESQIKTRQMMTVVTDQMIAPDNLSTNDIVVVNDELYKATANITSGEEMTVGTNVIKITLAEYIQSVL